MKGTLYWRYATRSLRRGGQRTLLAIFCVVVGVMAIVALQLVGIGVNVALTSNIHAALGGDIRLVSDIVPLTNDDLTYFDQLQRQGSIGSYTAVSTHRAQSAAPHSSHISTYSLDVVDPASFPLGNGAVFTTPAGGSIASVVQSNHVAITFNLLQDLGAEVGDALTITSDDGRSLQVVISGVLGNAGFFLEPDPTMVMAASTYLAATATTRAPLGYSQVYLDVPGHSDANAAAIEQDLNQRFPLAYVLTAQEALATIQAEVDDLRYFLQMVGLLALLIGGVGISNTIAVLLRRRTTEIAMLKTAGFRRRDLYLLFGLETGLIGLVGGAIGSAAGIGISFLVKRLMEQAFELPLPTVLDPLTIGSGVVIGLCTALIFGLLPIVQASQIRPLAVLRELPEGDLRASRRLTALLIMILITLFSLLAFSILRNLWVTLLIVGGVGLGLLLLGLFFNLVILGVSRYPIDERPRVGWIIVLAVLLLAALGVTLWSQAFGGLLLALLMLALAAFLLPRSGKATTRMALRNLGRQRARTVTTMIALFSGVFAIGMVLVIGTNLQQQLNTALSHSQAYNALIYASSAQDKSIVDQQLSQSGAVQREAVSLVAAGVPSKINGQALDSLLSQIASANRRQALRSIGLLVGVQGYDLAHGQTPDFGTVTLTQGRMLSAQDAGTGNALFPQEAMRAPLNLRVGDQIVLTGNNGAVSVTLTVKGFFTSSRLTPLFALILVDDGIVNTLSGGHPQYVYLLRLDPARTAATLAQIQHAAPHTQVLNIADVLSYASQLIGNLLLLLEAIASFSVLAGVISIANAVALAMLERRRELGILKSVGHTSRSVLGGVLLENGLTGFIGGLLAMLLVTLIASIVSTLVFSFLAFSIGAPVVLLVVLASVLLCMLIAAFVAWGATRLRPLDVLRYE